MFPAEPQETPLNRRRGPKPFFYGKKLQQLLRYLQRPDSTIESASVKFGCADSTIEKTLARLRAQGKAEGAPVPSTEPGRIADSGADESTPVDSTPVPSQPIRRRA